MAVISTQEVAKRLKISQRRVLQLIEEGRLKATRVGRTWAVDPRDLSAVKNRPWGRPRKNHEKGEAA